MQLPVPAADARVLRGRFPPLSAPAALAAGIFFACIFSKTTRLLPAAARPAVAATIRENNQSIAQPGLKQGEKAVLLRQDVVTVIRFLFGGFLILGAEWLKLTNIVARCKDADKRRHDAFNSIGNV